MVPSELRSARDVTRQIGQMLDSVNDGTTEKVVIMRAGRMAGVLVSADRYAELTANETLRAAA